MLVLLPPSETKAVGGDGPPLDLDGLLLPALRRPRERLLGALAELSADLPAARAALKVSAAIDAEIAANRRLRAAPTLPALRRYTGVLYDALDPAGLTAAARRRAESRIIVMSALFGAVRASDAIPAYRLSAGSVLPGVGPLVRWWRPTLGPALAALAAGEEPVLDLRSTAYAALAPLPAAITVRVVTEQPDGTRTVVSHFNKATKGHLARVVATSRAEIDSVAAVIRVARRAGLTVERTAERGLEVVS